MSHKLQKKKKKIIVSTDRKESGQKKVRDELWHTLNKKKTIQKYQIKIQKKLLFISFFPEQPKCIAFMHSLEHRMHVKSSSNA